MSIEQTVITYGDTALPTAAAAVTLFNSATAFHPGGCFHLLNLRWFQYTIATGTADGTGTGVVTGSFSNDKGTTWVPFFTGRTITPGNAAVGSAEADEIYVGQYRDVLFQFTQSTTDTSIFQVNIALDNNKSAAETAKTSTLGGSNPS